MSCWLALQNEVESVEYYPYSEDKMALELQKFLSDTESLLRMSG
jgi:hypothetical protein